MAKKEFARNCTECSKGMNEGYCFDGGRAYYCSNECLHKHYTPAEWAEMCANAFTPHSKWETQQMDGQNMNNELMDALADAANNLFWDFQDFTEIDETIEALDPLGTGDDLVGVNLKEVKDRAWNAFMAASAVLKKHRENKS